VKRIVTALLASAAAALTFTALLLPGVAAAQAGAEYVEQVPGFAGEEQTTVEADPQPVKPSQSEPQQRSAPAQAPTSQPEPVVTSESVTSSAEPAPVKRKRHKPRPAPLGAHDTPPVSTPSTTSSGELAPAGGGGDSLMWLALLLGAMAVAIPATAVYARRYGSA
jgi:hypothetical protein